MMQIKDTAAKWNILATGLGLVVVVLVVAAFFVPWYRLTFVYHLPEASVSRDYYITKWIQHDGSPEDVVRGYGTGFEKLAELMSQQSMFLILGLVFSATSVLLARNGRNSLGANVGAIAATMLFASVANFFWKINWAASTPLNSFSGRVDSTSISLTWGPMIGWLLSIAGCLTQSAQVVILVFSNEGKP